MQEVSLREFRDRGIKALGTATPGEPILLCGDDGPSYFLVPVFGDPVIEEAELRYALATASLLHTRSLAEAHGFLSDAEIDAEIRAVREERKRSAA